MYQILKKQTLNANTKLMVIEAPHVARKAEPGQFIILRVSAEGERIPLTIADFDRERVSVTIIFQEVGATTMALGALNEGDCLHDFVGPLGKASELEGLKKVAVVGGGLGCAIAYPQAKKLHEMGAEVDLIAGFRNKDIIILEDEMKNACTNLHIVTDDGSNGPQGSGYTGAQGADRRGQPVRCRYRHRPDDYDEVCLRDHPSVRHQDHRFHEHHHG